MFDEPPTPQEQSLVDRLMDVIDSITGEDWRAKTHRQTCLDAADALVQQGKEIEKWRIKTLENSDEIGRLRAGLRRIRDSVNRGALYYDIEELLNG